MPFTNFAISNQANFAITNQVKSSMGQPKYGIGPTTQLTLLSLVKPFLVQILGITYTKVDTSSFGYVYVMFVVAKLVSKLEHFGILVNLYRF